MDVDLFFLLGLVVLALVIPPKYDPAIRLKEWLERRGERRRR